MQAFPTISFFKPSLCFSLVPQHSTSAVQWENSVYNIHSSCGPVIRHPGLSEVLQHYYVMPMSKNLDCHLEPFVLMRLDRVPCGPESLRIKVFQSVCVDSEEIFVCTQSFEQQLKAYNEVEQQINPNPQEHLVATNTRTAMLTTLPTSNCLLAKISCYTSTSIKVTMQFVYKPARRHHVTPKQVTKRLL